MFHEFVATVDRFSKTFTYTPGPLFDHTDVEAITLKGYGIWTVFSRMDVETA
jgi:hypothetical protein